MQPNPPPTVDYPEHIERIPPAHSLSTPPLFIQHLGGKTWFDVAKVGLLIYVLKWALPELMRPPRRSRR